MKITAKLTHLFFMRSYAEKLCLFIFISAMLTPGNINADHGNGTTGQMRSGSPVIKNLSNEVDRCYRKKDVLKEGKEEHMDHGSAPMDMEKKSGGTASKKMAHMDHDSRHGGEFFMSSNKLHHVEGVYSAKCGFQLYTYNEYTE